MFDGCYKNKKVLITGNTGFKGTWLAIWLNYLGADVYGISKGIPSNPSMFQELDIEQKITYYCEDIKNLSAVTEIINKIKPDFIFHLAAQAIVSRAYNEPVETFQTNIIGTANILEVLRNYTYPCTAVMITSDKCYDNVEWKWGYRENDALGGKDPYSASKGAAELIIKTYYHSFFSEDTSNIRLASTRAGNVIGGGDWAADRIVPDCVRSWCKADSVEIRSPMATRPWQHVLEPLSGYLCLGHILDNDKRISGSAYNFGPDPGKVHTVAQLIRDMSKYWHFNHESDAYSVRENKTFHEATLLKLCIDKAIHELNWHPTLDYQKTVKFTSEWYYNFYNKKTDMYQFTIEQIVTYQKIAILVGNSWAE